MKLYEALYGFSFIEAPSMLMARQIRFPNSKRRRIRRKWAQRKANLELKPFDQLLYNAEEKTVCGHPVTIAALKAKVEASARAAGETWPNITGPEQGSRQEETHE